MVTGGLTVMVRCLEGGVWGRCNAIESPFLERFGKVDIKWASTNVDGMITYEFLNVADLAWILSKLKERLGRTQDRLVHEIRRIVSRHLG